MTDNCGEVVCDRLVIEELSRRFPSLSVTVLVRGQDALNDATREDAAQVGLDSVADIADNGCGVAGTPLEYVGEAARGLLEGADVILSKGQGNFETMHGCGLNVYYSFLCKCDWFQKRFGKRCRLISGGGENRWFSPGNWPSGQFLLKHMPPFGDGGENLWFSPGIGLPANSV